MRPCIQFLRARVALLRPTFAAAALWCTPAFAIGAQGAPFARIAPGEPVPGFAATAMFNAGSGPRCTPATYVVSQAAWRGASVAVVPMRISTPGLTAQGAPVATMAYASPSRHAWRVSADASVGPAERDCMFLSERSRAAVSLARAFGASGVQVSIADRSL